MKKYWFIKWNASWDVHRRKNKDESARHFPTQIDFLNEAENVRI